MDFSNLSLRLSSHPSSNPGPRRFAAGFLVALASFALLLFSPASAVAQGVPVHEIRLIAGTDLPWLDLDDWLASIGGTSFTVVSPPTYGSFVHGSYRSTPALFDVGADLARLDVLAADGTTSRHDVLFVVRDLERSDLQSEDFSGGWPVDWSVEGDPTLLDWVDDSGFGPALRAILTSTETGVAIGPLDDDRTNGYHAQGGAGSIIADPPNVGDDGVLSFFHAGPEAGTAGPRAVVELRSLSGALSVRVRSECTGCPGASTPWRDVPADVPIDFTLWSGPLAYDDDSAAPTFRQALRFSLDLPGTADDVTDWIDGEHDLEDVQIGMIDPDGGLGTSLDFGRVETWTEEDSETASRFVVDDFENGFNSFWTIEGPVSVTGEAPLRGWWSAAVDVGALRQLGGDAGLATDFGGQWQASVGTLFEVDLARLDLKAGERFNLVGGYGPAGGDQTVVQLRPAGAAYEIRLVARDGTGTRHFGTWTPISAGVHDLGFTWRADADGWAGLWIDGAPVDRLDALANSVARVDTLRIGASSPQLDATVVEESSLILDEVVVYR